MALAGILPWSAVAPLALAQGVTAEFAKAQKAYRAGQMKQAAAILSALVRKFPDHQPSHLLLGRIAYRSGKIGRAAQHFRKVPIDMIGPDIAYEFGVTMFTQKNCARATAAFARVPANSKAAGLAYFYRGVCYLRGREYQRAEAMLKRAAKLPPHLQSSRNEALAETRRQLARERRGQAPSGSPYFTVPTPPPQIVVASPPAASEPAAGAPRDAAKPEAAKPPPKPAPPKAGFDNSFTPAFTYEQSSQMDDYFGTSKRRSESVTTSFGLGLKSVYTAAAVDNGKQPTFSLGVDLGQKNVDSKGTRTKYIVYANDPGNVIEQESSDAPVIPSTKEASVKVVPEGVYPASSMIDLKLGYEFSEFYPDGASDKMRGFRTPYAVVVVNGESMTLEVRGSQKEAYTSVGTMQTDVTVSAKVTRNSEAVDLSLAFSNTTASVGSANTLPPDPAESTQTIEATANKSWDTFSLVGAVKNVSYTPAKGQVKILEASNLKLSVSLTKTLDIGGAMTLSASQTQLNDYTLLLEPIADPAAPATTFESARGLCCGERTEFDSFLQDEATPPAKVPIKAQGSSQNILATLKLAPIDWGYVQASYDYTVRDFSVDNGAYTASFQQAASESTGIFKLTLGLSKTF